MPRPKTYDRAAGLEQAMCAFWVTGYPGTSMRDVFTKTGIAPKSLYAEFGGKEELFLASIDTYIQDAIRSHKRTLGGVPHGLERIESHLVHQAAGGDIRGCLLVNTLAESASVPAAALRRIEAFFADVRRIYAVNLRAARESGEIRPDIDPEALAGAFLTFDQGLAIAAKSATQSKQLADSVSAFIHAIRT